MPNCSPKGIRYGVIAMNSLDPDLAQDLWYGPDAVNVSEEEALAEAKAEFEAEWDAANEQAHIAATETDAHMAEAERERFVEKWLEDHGFGDDREYYVERKCEWLELQIDEPFIKGTYGGVTYEIHWLGGAPLLTVTHGPVGYAISLCSPCVPGAADLDGGFEPWPEQDECHGYQCYVVPKDWLYKEVA